MRGMDIPGKIKVRTRPKCVRKCQQNQRKLRRNDKTSDKILTNPFKIPKMVPRRKDICALLPVSNPKENVSLMVAILSLVLGDFFLEPPVFTDAPSEVGAPTMSFSVSSILADHCF